MKEKVAAYIRVSTASDAQTHSYEFQESHWRSQIEKDSKQELVGIYADLGISGRVMSKRPQFKAMVEDCRQGLINKIYVKSVSRFARNTVELLDMIRELRELGVAVIFEQENINTLKIASDVYLTIAAALAEADLKRYSENQRWAIAHKYANGVIAIGNKIYGYKMTKDNDLIPIEEEANKVKEIFDKYESGWSVEKIANYLNKNQVETVRKVSKWRGTTIMKMLKNDRYIGNSLQHKYVKIDGQKYDNTGGKYKRQLMIENSHKAIITKEQFQKVQELISQRTNHKLVGKKTNIHLFTGVIRCAVCGKNFTHKINNSGTISACEVWNCARKLKEGKCSCSSNGIKDEIIREKFVQAFDKFVTEDLDRDVVTEAKNRLRELLYEENEIKKLMAQGYIKKNHFDEACKEIERKIRDEEQIINRYKLKNVTKRDYEKITKFEESKFDKFIAGIIIDEWKITFEFLNGAKVTLPYKNGEPGNIKDWVEKNRRKNNANITSSKK